MPSQPTRTIRLGLSGFFAAAMIAPFGACSSAPNTGFSIEEQDGAAEAQTSIVATADSSVKDAATKDGGAKDSGKKDGSKSDGATPTVDAGTFAPEGSPCTTTKPEESLCGKCGTKARACLDDGTGNKVWGAWGSCLGELTDDDACDPTIVHPDEDCGNCGKRGRICQLDCRFVPGLTCQEPTFNGEAACAPTSKEFLLGVSCTGTNQGRSRTCSATCQWGGLGACETFTVNASVPLISGGSSTVCSVLANGTVKCWGDNYSGQLGNGTNTSSSTPVQVTGLSGALSVSTYYEHACALLAGGTVKCWGDNGYGQLGATGIYESNVPVAVAGISGAQAITTGYYHACAIVGGGAVKCWGYGAYGALGDGTTTSTTTAPVTVSGLTGAVALSAGANHTCALVSGGTVKCWGYNSSGQIGNGATTTATTPVQVAGLTGVMSLAAGANHTCAILGGGTVKCWGENGYGQLGSGTSTDSLTPVVVPALSGALGLAGGASQTCALVGGGAAKCWGYGIYGSLGNGANSSSNVPVPVSNLSGATSLACGASFCCARLGSGAAKCWGEGYEGTLGNGSSSDSNVPVNVSGLP